MRFSFCKNNQELGAVSVSHLWSDVYATEGLKGVINFLHTKMKAQNIKAWIDTCNEPFIRIVKRLGFKQVHFIKNADEFKGSVSDEFVFELELS